MKCIEAIGVACKHSDAKDILQRALITAESNQDLALITRLKKSLKSLGKKPAALAPVEVTTDAPQQALAEEDPRWQQVRDGLGTLRELGRSFLEVQAWIGWYLTCLRKDHKAAGGTHGGDRKSSAQSGHLIPWPELVKEKTGLPRTTAERFMDLYEASLAKLKKGKTPEQKAALAILKSGNPLSVPDDQRGALRDVISSLCVGETQASLMQELGVVPTPPKLVKKQGEKEPDDDKLSEPELALHHWETAARPLFKAREGEGAKLLHFLPPTSEEPGKLSLSFLLAEAEAFAADVRAALEAHAKPSKALPAA